MKQIFLFGPPAVGKLTVALELARLTQYRLFHNHLTVDLVSSLFPFGSEPFVALREQIWLAAFSEAARHDVSLIFTFAPERTVSPGFAQRALEVVKSAGGETVFVELTCSEEALEARLTDPSRSEFAKLVSVAEYRTLRKEGAFTFPRIPADVSFDTTNTLPSKTAQAIIEALPATSRKV
jgi:hypothetical protein